MTNRRKYVFSYDPDIRRMEMVMICDQGTITASVSTDFNATVEEMKDLVKKMEAFGEVFAKVIYPK